MISYVMYDANMCILFTSRAERAAPDEGGAPIDANPIHGVEFSDCSQASRANLLTAKFCFRIWKWRHTSPFIQTLFTYAGVSYSHVRWQFYKQAFDWFVGKANSKSCKLEVMFIWGEWIALVCELKCVWSVMVLDVWNLKLMKGCSWARINICSKRGIRY